MTRSRARASRPWIILVALLLLTGVAAAGRKRVVVLEFEGDKAEKFQAEVVRLIKKSHTVVSTDKWNGTAEEMSATKLTDKNVKKVAKKLKVDGVISGNVEKRRDEYILRLKLRAGGSGELVGSQINIKSDSTKLDGTAAKDVKDELIDVIGDLESNRDGGGDDDDEGEEEKPKKGGFVKKPADDDDEKPKKPGKGDEKIKKPADDDEEKPKKGVVGKKPADDEEKPKKPEKPAKPEKKPDDVVAVKAKPSDDDEEEKPKKPAKVEAKPKQVSVDDDDDEPDDELGAGIDDPPVTGDAMYAPSERAVDAAVGMSFTARRMAFSYNRAAVLTTPAGYKQVAPVPGVYVDATLYPLAFGHKRKDILRHFGATVMFDRVLALSSKNPNGNVKLKSAEQRYALGVAFRYPLGQGAKAPVVGAALRFGKQSFTIDGDSVIPDVGYTMFDFTGTFQYPLNAKMQLNFSAAALLPTSAGEITTLAQYGRAKLTGLEGSAGLDYLVTKNIFARAEARLETIGYAFLQEGAMKAMGVAGARDTYFGGVLTAGFLY